MHIQILKEENERNLIKLNEMESLDDTETKLKHANSLESGGKKKVHVWK